MEPRLNFSRRLFHNCSKLDRCTRMKRKLHLLLKDVAQRQAEREIRGSFSIKEFLWPIQRLRTVDRFANIVQFQRESTPFAPVPQLFEGKHDCHLRSRGKWLMHHEQRNEQRKPGCSSPCLPRLLSTDRMPDRLPLIFLRRIISREWLHYRGWSSKVRVVLVSL